MEFEQAERARVAERFGEEMALGDYVALLRRHRRLVRAVFAVCVLGALGLSLATPTTYQSTTTVLLRTSFNQNLFPSVGDSLRGDFGRNGRAEWDYAQSGALEALAGSATPAGATVDVRYDADLGDGAQNASNFLEFVATSNDPLDAQTAADVWANAYLDSRQRLAVDELDATIELVQGQIADLEVEKADLLAPIAPIDDALLVETDGDVIGRLTTQRLSLLQGLSDDLQPVQTKLRTLNDDLSSLEITASFLERDGISARINSAAAPGSKVGPLVARNLVLAGVVGLILGAAAALLRENLQTTIDGVDDLERALPGVPVLAELPPLGDGGGGELDAALDSGTPYVESIERLVTALGLLSKGVGGNRFLFTSPLPSEGKTTVVSHTALRIAMGGEKAAAVDADLRRPRLHSAFGVANSTTGFAAVLRGESELFPAVLKVGPVPHVDGGGVKLLPAGPPTDQAASLFRSSHAPISLSKLGAVHDAVIVDSPPVLPVSDSQSLAAGSIDHVIMVVMAERTTRNELAGAAARMRAAGNPVVGVVLTNATVSGGGAYGYANASGEEPDGQQLEGGADLFAGSTPGG